MVSSIPFYAHFLEVSVLQLVMIRHLESEGNVRKAGQGLVETPSHEYGLTPRGKKQGELTRQFLLSHFQRMEDQAGKTNKFFFVSRMRRAIETAFILFPQAAWERDVRLNEADRGIWASDADHELVAKQYPEEVIRRQKLGWYMYRPPGGENNPDMEARVHSWTESVIRRFSHRASIPGEDCRIYVIVHGFWYNSFSCLSEGRDSCDLVGHDHHKVESIENGSVTIYDHVPHSPLGFKRGSETYVPWRDKL